MNFKKTIPRRFYRRNIPTECWIDFVITMGPPYHGREGGNPIAFPKFHSQKPAPKLNVRQTILARSISYVQSATIKHFDIATKCSSNENSNSFLSIFSVSPSYIDSMMAPGRQQWLTRRNRYIQEFSLVDVLFHVKCAITQCGAFNPITLNSHANECLKQC